MDTVIDNVSLRNKSHRKVSYIVVGAVNRGSVYATYALENPHIAQVVAVAEPRPAWRELFVVKHGVVAQNVFSDWKEVLERDKFADAVVVTTPDALHAEPVIAFANKGYHILVEKPMAVSEADCIRMTRAARDNNVILAVGHVMRYTPYTQKIKDIVQSGVLGTIASVQHLEPVGNWHFAHSYVRGNWRKESESTFSLMAKSCHDVDWLRYVIGLPCTRVSSFGSLLHFRKERKPKEAGDAKRCLDCALQETCAYSAKQIYRPGNTGWPVNIITPGVPDIESVTAALRDGPYGRCVYECDNDVCDQQVVNLEFEGGATASFSMVAFTERICQRQTRVFGTLGELECDGETIKHTDFRWPHSTRTLQPAGFAGSQMTGHGGADWYLMDSFIEAVATDNPAKILSGPTETLESHLLVFAAEKARRTGTVISTDSIATLAIQS
eukprot:TRINITY_DN31083_c0_g1_i1.p1 TRINITY_DN31083_c0_g1~~TRINITY_DN31083_c0_g1_i1.p1  ORF type:complete len:440 (+),score=128.09 TRINITY_DN31083_c0_g1_i1:87-1406(+)